MELSDLQIFRAVVEAGGITRAAAKLHRVQSNITTRVKNLEEELGVALFVREGKKMQLSPSGRVLYGYAQRLQALADEAREALLDARPRGTFRLGAMESTAAARLPSLLATLHERHPAVNVELHTGAPRELTMQVLAGELDAALVTEPVSDARLGQITAFVEELIVVGAAGQSKISTPRDVTKRTLLAFEPGCPHRQRLEEWFSQAEVAPERIVEMGSYHAILGCAAAGMGIALMPRSVLDTYSERSHLSVHRPRGEFTAVRTLLIWRRDAPQSNITAFAELLPEAQRSRAQRKGRPAV